jgi:soluble lytic murein transglycosylase
VTPFRLILLTALLLTATLFMTIRRIFVTDHIPVPEVRTVVLDPYDDPLLMPYQVYRNALLAADTQTLRELAGHRDDFVAYRAARTLAEDEALEPTLRAHYFRRYLDLRIDDPLDRIATRALTLEYAKLAETAGLIDQAISAYEAALPMAEAASGLRRLVNDPYRLANIFFNARRYRDALAALDGRAAPSIEAPSYRALGEHTRALAAYERWLQEDPNNLTARLGKAWSHYFLGELQTADALFAQLGEPYPRGLIARQQGDIDRAVAFMRESGEAYHLWLATGYLEARHRYADAIPVYLQLAQTTSAYADDAAYRAYVLAGRLGDSEAAQTARALLGNDSFFGLRLGETVSVPQTSTLPEVRPQVIDVANRLARINDMEAAIGELLFALRASNDPAETVAIAEHLQLLGEFRQSQREAALLLNAGVRDRRVYKLAYPKAYPQVVLEEARRHELEPALIWAVMRQESAFFPRAVSVSNAQGLMQVIPSTWDWLAELQREAPGDPFDIATNVRYGAYYLRWLLNYLGGDLELVVASYNRGQGYIRRLYEGELVAGDRDELYRHIDAFETREYLQRVIMNYEIYQALYPTVLAEHGESSP